MAFNQFPQKGGIPSGATATRPSSPATGDTFYNGELGILEIWTGSAWFPCSAPPATPTNVIATDASINDAYTSTAGKLSVAFNAGSGGGQPTNYIAYTTSGGFSSSGASSPIIITGLTPGTAYTTYVVAQNGFGNSAASGNAAATTPTTLPEVPTIGTATASSSTTGEVTVTWTLGNNGGKNLSAITITPFLNGTTAQTSRTAATTSSTSYTFTTGQLTAGSSYTFKVKATNANGTSADSTASNSVTAPNFVTVDYLVVAGGASGGNGLGGGGGAGGLRSTITGSGGGGGVESAAVISIGNNYTVTVGAGGSAPTDVMKGNNGSNSVFSTITSTGGGGGGSYYESPYNGLTGGSGGGGGSRESGGNSTGGDGTANQGYGGGAGAIRNGSSGGSGTYWAAGGGGGANGTGGNFNTYTNGGAGGNGRAVSITGSSVTYAGGGGGNAYAGTGGTGGSGGGGAGGDGSGGGTNGTDNLGAGGGGNGAGSPPGKGGSGVVILRWLTSSATITVGAGLTADATGTDGSYSYKKFTAGSGNVSFA